MKRTGVDTAFLRRRAVLSVHYLIIVLAQGLAPGRQVGSGRLRPAWGGGSLPSPSLSASLLAWDLSSAPSCSALSLLMIIVLGTPTLTSLCRLPGLLFHCSPHLSASLNVSFPLEPVCFLRNTLPAHRLHFQSRCGRCSSPR